MNARQPNLAAAIRVLLGQKRQALEQLEAALVTFEREFGLDMAGPPKQIVGKVTRRAQIAAGSLEDRVLSAAKEPVRLQDLIEAGGARTGDVKKAVKALVACGRLARTGRTMKTRYQAQR